MCGIAGWLFKADEEPAPDRLGRMAQAISHRGPDDEGFYRLPAAGLALAHRRLSIIDLSDASHQPMIDDATGVVLAYNGEIYNFRGLRRELQDLGHRFRSAGDTEVLLRAWLQWGVDCLPRLAGMFAFALWDPRSATLHLARDATGMKPLYLYPAAQGAAFASEVKAFRELPGFVGRLDAHGLQQFLEFGYVFDGCGTSLSGVEKLLPGQRVELRAGRVVRRVTWFTPNSPDHTDERDEAARVAELGVALDLVVGEHLIADVPVGLLLSGGLDSSLGAALAARRGRLTTICMGFGNSDVDERAQAQTVAAHIGSDHHELLIQPQELQQEIQHAAWVFDDLFADWGTLTTRLLYRRCRAMGLKVVLVGEGADELFGGYDVFNLPPRLGLWQQFRLYQRYAGRRYGKLFGAFRAALREALDAGAGDPFHAVRLFESRRQLPNNYVMKVDKASMSESVEARAPYLDWRIAELAWRTPAAWLQRGGENKYLLRSLARQQGLLPTAISARKKFGAPLAVGWMDDDADFRDFARSTILAPGSQTERLGLAPAMRAYFDEGQPGDPLPLPLSVFRNLA
ncbi:MAG: N-acetylglutaminylglutamine amidotransferase [Tibeticola sp.]